jgi:D-glycero-D-manno-heptose 1,7-bisphosphate phosphatase
MRAAILAGGRGTRIGGLYPDLPKPMIPVAGKPLLRRQIESLEEQGIKDITLVIGYKAGVISDYFGDGGAFGAKIKYIVEEEPLGTGGAMPLLPKDDTLVLLGDVYVDVDFSRFIAFHRAKKSGVSLFVHPNSHPHDSDIVIADAEDRVLEWRSKKDARSGDMRNLVNAGIYIFSEGMMPSGEAERRDLERNLIVPLIRSRKVFAYRSTEYVKDMGTPKRLESITLDIESGAAGARNMRNKQRAVFVDRDGTINEERGLITNPEEISLVLDAAEAIRKLNRSPFLTICVTNQPVIARGMAAERLDAIHARLDTLLGKEGAYLDDLFFCPHHPDKGYPEEVPELKIDCGCRKPKPGMLLAAAKKYNVDLAASFMIGDSTADILAGQSAGCATIGVKSGVGLADGKYCVMPDRVCGNLLEAVRWILEGA